MLEMSKIKKNYSGNVCYCIYEVLALKLVLLSRILMFCNFYLLFENYFCSKTFLLVNFLLHTLYYFNSVFCFLPCICCLNGIFTIIRLSSVRFGVIYLSIDTNIVHNLLCYTGKSQS